MKDTMILRTGKAKVSVLDRSVFKRLGKTYDAGCVSRHGVYSTPFSWQTSQAGRLSVVKAVNGLAADGAVAEFIQTTVLLPVSAREQQLRLLEDQIAQAAAEFGLRVQGGHTEVTPAVTRPVITVTAYAAACPAGDKPAPDVQVPNPEEESDIVITRWAGLEGTYLLACERREELQRRFPARILESALSMGDMLSILPDARLCGAGENICVDASDGGIFAALWRLSEKTGKGFEVDLSCIPVRQETIEITDYLGINPYQMLSGGCLVAAVRNGAEYTERLTKAGIPAVAAGRMTKRNSCILRNGDEIRYLDMPEPDSLLPLLG